MAIKSVSISDFTVFENTHINFCDGVNVIIGENGTGKTHLLKLLYAANDMHLTGQTHSISSLFGISFSSGKNYLLQILDVVHAWSTTFEFSTDLKLEMKQLPTSHIFCDIKEKRNSTFIPAKEALSMSGLVRIAYDYEKKLDIDVTLTNIIRKAENLVLSTPPLLALKIAERLEALIEGQVFYNEKSKSFWIHKTNGDKIPFTSEAEGFKKLGLLWQLLMNKSITENSILLWDEPESNLNPQMIPVVVDILLELSRHGVQVFLTTHDYVFAKYFEVRCETNDTIAFHSLYKTDDGVKCETNNNFRELQNNPIISAFDVLMDEVISKNMGD